MLDDVDESMIVRVSDWLLSRRYGSGSFRQKSNGLDSFSSPPPDIADAYILYVLTQIGQAQGLEKEIEEIIKKTKNSED